MLYDIILSEPSTLFHVTHDCVTVTLSCNWGDSVVMLTLILSPPKIREKEVTNKK